MAAQPASGCFRSHEKAGRSNGVNQSAAVFPHLATGEVDEDPAEKQAFGEIEISIILG
jgi:hypothetical protein